MWHTAKLASVLYVEPLQGSQFAMVRTAATQALVSPG